MCDVIVTNVRQCGVWAGQRLELQWMRHRGTELLDQGRKDTSVSGNLEFIQGSRQRLQSSKFLCRVTNELDKSDGSGGWKWPSLP